jgi:isocitrate dehydrogenase
MSGGDFYGSEKSTTVTDAWAVKIEYVSQDGKATVLKEKTTLKAGEVIDAAVMSRRELRKFYEEQIQDAKNKGCIISLHLKAT